MKNTLPTQLGVLRNSATFGKKNKATFNGLLALFLMVMGIGMSWGQTAIIPKLYLTAQNTPSGNTGWTITNATINNGGTDYWKMINTNAVLETPAMNLDSYSGETCVLKLGTTGTVNAAKQTITVTISLNNGSTWSPLTTQTPTSSTSTAMTAINLSSYIGTQVKLRFANLGGDSSTGVRFFEAYITGTIAATTPTLSIMGTTAHGSVCSGAAATTQTYTITNTGTAASNVVVSSSDSQFVVNNLSSTSIGATNGTATYDVTFTPSSSGAKTATITVYYDTSTSATTSSLTGTGSTPVTQAVTASAASSVTAKSATLNGNYTTLGVCPATIEKGFVYSLTSDNNDPLVSGTGVTKTSVTLGATGAYTFALTGLASSTSYSYKAYVYNGTTYTYGTLQTFTTLAALAISGTTNNGTICPNIASTPITYTVTNNSTSTVSDVSVTSNDPQFVVSTISSTTIAAAGTATYTVTFTPSSAGSKTATVTVSGTSVVSVTSTPTGTGTTPVTQAVSTNAATSIVNTTVTLNGNYGTAGVCPNTYEKGFVYAIKSTNSDPLVLGTGVTKSTVTLGSTGNYLLALTSLIPNTTYTYKAYVYNGATYTYGTATDFSTLATATKLVFSVSPPTTGIVGVNLTSFTVQAQRIDNTVDTEYIANITIGRTIISGSGALTGTTATAVAGVATFAATQFDSVGSYTITASSGSLTPTIAQSNTVISLAPTALAGWNFSASTMTGTAPTANANANVTVGTLTRGSAVIITGTTYAREWGGYGWSTSSSVATAAAAGWYLSFTITPKTNYVVSFNNIPAYQFYSNSSGPINGQWQYSLNGTTFTGFADITFPSSGALLFPTIDLSTITALQNVPSTTTVTFRIVGYGGSSATAGTFAFYDGSGSTAADFSVAGFINAPTNNWIGSTGNWNTTTNWSLGTVPVSTDNITITNGSPVMDIDYTLGAGRTLTISGTGVLTINSGKTLTIAGTADFGGKSVTLKSDATGTGTIGQVTGTLIGANNVTVERYIPFGKRAFRLLTPSVTTTSTVYNNWQISGATTAGQGTHITGSTTVANGFDVTASGNPSMFTYENNVASGTGWLAIPNTDVTTLTAGMGYRTLVRGDRNVDISVASTDNMNVATTLSATGALKVGNVVFDSSSTPALNNTISTSSNTTTNDFSLIGNPYASPVNWSLVTKNNVGDTYYTWDPNMGTAAQRGRYVAYDITTGRDIPESAVSQYIQPGQAFFVKTTAASPVLTFKEADKATSFTNVFRTNEMNSRLSISVYNPTEVAFATPIDGTTAVFGTDFNTTIGVGDVEKLFSAGESLAWSRGTKLLAIDALAPVVANDELHLKTMQFAANKSYTFKINATNFDNTLTAFLVDQYLNTQTQVDLTAPNFVTFATTADVASYGTDRFKVVFSPSSALNNAEWNSKSLHIYPNPVVDNQFTIAVSPSITDKVMITIYNMIGQSVYKESATAINNAILVRPSALLKAGVYMVEMVNNGKTNTQKIIIK